MNMSLPDWLDREAYPFTPHTLDVGPGRMSYVDEGDGLPVLMLHGNPTWSFLYRHVIKQLAPRYRCVAPDYLGFGLSDKPTLPNRFMRFGNGRGEERRKGRTSRPRTRSVAPPLTSGAGNSWSYHPAQHARTVVRLVEHLDLRDLTLVVQDWGGPIGMHLAVHQPERVRRLVVMNTWAWPVDDDPRFVWFSRIAGGLLGRLLVRRFNAFARWAMPLAFADRSRLTPEIHRHYLAPLDVPEHREGAAFFPRDVAGAAAWLRTIWERRDVLAGRPVLLLWGLCDPAFRERELEQWHALFPEAEVHRLPDVGHYVQEELGERLGSMVEAFLERTA